MKTVVNSNKTFGLTEAGRMALNIKNNVKVIKAPKVVTPAGTVANGISVQNGGLASGTTTPKVIKINASQLAALKNGKILIKVF